MQTNDRDSSVLEGEEWCNLIMFFILSLKFNK